VKVGDVEDHPDDDKELNRRDDENGDFIALFDYDI
jgi:hypothetical protein